MAISGMMVHDMSRLTVYTSFPAIESGVRLATLTGLIVCFLATLALAGPAWSAQSPDQAKMTLALTLTKETVDPGQAVGLAVQLLNSGPAEQPAGRLKVSLGAETLFDQTIGPIKSGASAVHHFRVVAPDQPGVFAAVVEAYGQRLEKTLTVEKGGGGRFNLAVTWLDGPSKGCLDKGPWSNQVSVTNTGQKAAPTCRLDLIVNGDPTLRVPVPALRPGERHLVSFTWDRGKAGRNTLIAELKELEKDQSTLDNRALRHFQLTDCRPDLAVTSLRLLGPIEAGRRPMTAQAEVTNSGGGAAEQVAVRFLVNGLEIKALKLVNLAPGAKRTLKVSWMPPQAGTYWLKVVVDSERGVLESNENNNRRQIKFTTLAAAADLKVEHLEINSRQCLDKGAIELPVVVRNAGRAASEPTELAFRADYRVLATRKVPALAPGQTEKIVFFWAPDKPGNYDLVFRVDPHWALDDPRQSDNKRVTKILVQDCRPDLALIPPRLPAQMGLGRQDKPLRFKVTNRGLTDARNVETVLIAGPDKVAAQTSLIKANSTALVDLDWAPSRTGVQEFEVMVDPNGRIDEPNRANNSYTARIKILPPAVDLALVQLALVPSRVTPGEPFRVEATVHNRSRVPSGRFRLVLRLDGKQIAEEKVGGMWAGAKKRIEFNPGRPARSGMIVEVELDPSDRLRETDETNNIGRLKLP